MEQPPTPLPTPPPAPPPRIDPEASARDLITLVRAVADGTADFTELISVLMPVLRDRRSLPDHLALQLSTALYDVERAATSDDQLFALVNREGAPSLALSESGHILTLNGSAFELFSVSAGDGLSILGISREEFAAFQRRLADTSDPTLLWIRPAPNRTGSHASSGPRTHPVLATGVYFPWYRAFVLTVLQHHWPASVDRAFRELYHLSPSELDVLSMLARGTTAESIAALRGSSPATVRQQIKSILFKMGVQTQAAAATIAASAAASTAASGDRGGHPSGLVPLRGPQSILRTETFSRGQRRVGWRHFGDPQGDPVLYLHGPSFGAGEYPDNRVQSQRRRMSVYAIERPGYGRTDIPGQDEEVLECSRRDIEMLLDREGLERVTILAHEVALIAALDLAHAHPQRIRGVLAVSASPPFVQLEQLHAIPDHQAIFIQAARHAPWLAHLLIRLLVIQIRRLGPHRWTDVIFRGLSPDTTVMRRPELLPGIIGTYSFCINQAGLGFEQDLKLMHLDWSALVRTAPVPVRLMHGAQNPTTPAADLAVFRTLRPNISVDLIPSAGLTLAVSHPHLVYAALRELIDETA
ncbi:MAG: hypothetical protein EA403_14110 [Spirochaetaceae bacterium]|nr:MAG: hypothetical protein EA403_14110 [Spirochaetaceae bacterium]